MPELYLRLLDRILTPVLSATRSLSLSARAQCAGRRLHRRLGRLRRLRAADPESRRALRAQAPRPLSPPAHGHRFAVGRHRRPHRSGPRRVLRERLGEVRTSAPSRLELGNPMLFDLGVFLVVVSVVVSFLLGLSSRYQGARPMINLVLALLVGVLLACGTYLLLRRDAVKLVLGLSLLSYGINFVLFASGRLGRGMPPIVPDKEAFDRRHLGLRRSLAPGADSDRHRHQLWRDRIRGCAPKPAQCARREDTRPRSPARPSRPSTTPSPKRATISPVSTATRTTMSGSKPSLDSHPDEVGIATRAEATR